MTSITQDIIKSQSDEELPQIIAWAQSEVAERTERRKRDAIAKIRELAATVGVTVAIEGTRGRPRRSQATPGPDRATQPRGSGARKLAPTLPSSPAQAGRTPSLRAQ